MSAARGGGGDCWAAAEAVPGKCSKELWTVLGSRRDAQTKCDNDSDCKGLMWYHNVDNNKAGCSEDCADGRTANRGWYHGCGGSVGSFSASEWTTYKKPVCAAASGPTGTDTFASCSVKCHGEGAPFFALTDGTCECRTAFGPKPQCTPATLDLTLARIVRSEGCKGGASSAKCSFHPAVPCLTAGPCKSVTWELPMPSAGTFNVTYMSSGSSFRDRGETMRFSVSDHPLFTAVNEGFVYNF